MQRRDTPSSTHKEGQGTRKGAVDDYMMSSSDVNKRGWGEAKNATGDWMAVKESEETQGNAQREGDSLRNGRRSLLSDVVEGSSAFPLAQSQVFRTDSMPSRNLPPSREQHFPWNAVNTWRISQHTPHLEMDWASAPPADAPYFNSPLKRMDRYLLDRVANCLRDDKEISILNLSSSILYGRSLGTSASIIPEVAEWYRRMTNHQVKCVAMIDDRVRYQTPWRAGTLRIRAEGGRCRDAHISFASPVEADRFGRYGCAPLAILIQSHLLGRQNKLLKDLEKAVQSGRVEKVIIITCEDPPFWFDPCSLFDKSKTTVQFWHLT